MAPRRTRRIHKGGRPRHARPTVDLGTPELAAKRAATAADPILTTCPLDLALGRRLIDDETHAAAGYFAACRALVFGSPHLRALDLLRVSGAPTITETSHAEARYHAACAELRRRGPHVLSAVEMFVVHHKFPRWLVERTEHPSRGFVMDGLAALRDWYRGRRRAA